MIERLVETEADRKLAIRLLTTRRLPYRISLKDGRLRSVDQNRLLWQWINDAAEQTGLTPKAQQNEWKLNFGVPILAAANDDFFDAWAPITGLDYEKQLRMVNFIAVTSIMTMKQMKAYLDHIEIHCAENSIELTNPEALQYAKDSSRVDRRDTRHASASVSPQAHRGTPGRKVR